MRRNDAIKLTAVTCLLLLILPILLLVWGFLLPAQYNDTFLGEMKYKCRLLEEAEGRRIVLIGGSAVAFGTDSALAEQALPGFRVVNFGMYAALGTTVMLDLAESALRPGDIVILSPEQQEQTLSCWFGAEAMWQAADGAFDLLARLDRERWGAMAGQFPSFAGGKLRYVLQGQEPVAAAPYSRSSFNEYGDIASGLCPANLMPGGYDISTPIRFSSEVLSPDFVDTVNAFARRQAARGVEVWYRFCPMNALAVEDLETLEDYWELLQSSLEIPIIGDPYDCILAAEWFYDTNFHLNDSGRLVNTRSLVRDIKAMLGDSSPTRIALPTAPPLGWSVAPAGDDSDADCFLALPMGDGVILTGLTEEGRGRERLVLPTRWQGVPVVALSAEVFAGNETIRSIVVQEGLASIQDRAFQGCTALETLELLSSNPGRCLVGRHLLEGTSCIILVPAEALSAYRVHYFWSEYAPRIQSGTFLGK